jgi:hypothetical protein
LIAAGARLFGAHILVAEVAQQSREIELDALRAAHAVPVAEADLAEEWDSL